MDAEPLSSPSLRSRAVAAGRDPRLAPEAARSALAIATSLRADDLARREVDPAVLAPARASLAALAADATARSDLRVAAAMAVERLEHAAAP
ncbi:MAG: hypothetical protein M5U28_09450 [Sandaracinaceae bacterium]|nr:hypothetical protein [Sandaracinaceae bacterium]